MHYLGSGAFGNVYAGEARDIHGPGTGTVTVAVKTLQPNAAGSNVPNGCWLPAGFVDNVKRVVGIVATEALSLFIEQWILDFVLLWALSHLRNFQHFCSS